MKNKSNYYGDYSRQVVIESPITKERIQYVDNMIKLGYFKESIERETDSTFIAKIDINAFEEVEE